MIELTSAWLPDPGDAVAQPLNHSKNINVGIARLIWAESCTPFGKSPYPAGWVLPGGERTDNRTRAMRVAKNMDRLMSAH